MSTSRSSAERAEGGDRRSLPVRLLRFLVLCGGLTLAGLVLAPHLPTVGESLARVGPGVLLYLAASAVVFWLDCLGWQVTLSPEQPNPGFWRVFGARMAGEAVNKVTPIASLGGEPLKAYLLTRWGSAARPAFASVLIAKNTMTIAQAVFVLVGVAVACWLFPERRPLLLGLAAFPLLVLVLIGAAAVLDHRLRRLRRTAAPSNRLLALWAQVAEFYWQRPRAFWLSIAFHFLGWAAGALELLTAAWLLGFPLQIPDALALEALLVSVNMATFFVPANAGTQEGGFALLAPLFGISQPHAVAMAVLRRLRDLFWIAFGLLFLTAVEGRLLLVPRPEADPDSVEPCFPRAGTG